MTNVCVTKGTKIVHKTLQNIEQICTSGSKNTPKTAKTKTKNRIKTPEQKPNTPHTRKPQQEQHHNTKQIQTLIKPLNHLPDERQPYLGCQKRGTTPKTWSKFISQTAQPTNDRTLIP